MLTFLMYYAIGVFVFINIVSLGERFGTLKDLPIDKYNDILNTTIKRILFIQLIILIWPILVHFLFDGLFRK